ncbi:MAG: hypothetical protein LBS43_01585 [Prevotellaceae bacterium]|jgi:hypothetical protein|nr:hypothetical protein [Prevotellaceae bacterium]
MSTKTKTDSQETQETFSLTVDNNVALDIISTIIDDEVIELTSAPQKYEQNDIFQEKDFTVRVRTKEGEHKTVSIEVLKFAYRTDFMRTWNRLDRQYSAPDKPVYGIFFVGEGVTVKKAPVITSRIRITDMITGEELKDVHCDFVDSLYYYSRSWIIQIPELKGTRFEKTLKLFEQ